ncbi:MAG: HAD family hydrolase [Oscillospiraceae bacterium]
MITTVLFDLDGTLLPFEQEDFIKIYFGELCKRLAHLGYEPQHTVKSVWAGTKSMVINDGSRPNYEAFWETFNAMNLGLPDARRECDAFYTQEFDRAKACLKYIPDRKPLIDRLKQAGLKVVLATNPLFPLDGVVTRMKWVNLSPEDFELITYYDNSTSCKPNPAYFTEILGKIGEPAENCVMIGNNVSEDMSAEKLGMKVFLANEFVENPENADFSRYPQGSLDEAVAYALSINK